LADVVHGDAGAAATGAVLAVARAARRPQDVGFVTSACIFERCERKKKRERSHTRGSSSTISTFRGQGYVDGVSRWMGAVLPSSKPGHAESEKYRKIEKR
jgi:hypothetical protein